MGTSRPKLCGAMDGGAQASQGRAEGACFGREVPIGLCSGFWLAKQVQKSYFGRSFPASLRPDFT